MACSSRDSPSMVEKHNNSTPIKHMAFCSPVRHSYSSAHDKQQTPLSQIQRFVHSGVQLLANTPSSGKNLQTPELSSGRSHLLTPLSVNSNIQVVLMLLTNCKNITMICLVALVRHQLKGEIITNVRAQILLNCKRKPLHTTGVNLLAGQIPMFQLPNKQC